MVATAPGQYSPPSVKVDDPTDAPVSRISARDLQTFGGNLDSLFRKYVADRRIAELRWLRNERQYLGIYDPELDKALSPDRSRVYPRLTRVKCISVLSRIMNLMFPGNEKNWTLKASPSPDMSPDDMRQAVQDAMKRDQDAGIQPQVDVEYALAAMQSLADSRAVKLTTLIEDQLEEIGGDQSLDYLALNRAALKAGIIFGPGLLIGPYVRTKTKTEWIVDPLSQQPMPTPTTAYMPHFEFLSVWDWYPDMGAKTLVGGDGYFIRRVMSRSQVRELAEREDFFEDVITKYIKDKQLGNYIAQMYETELRMMGVKINVNEQKPESAKFEVIIWHGPVSGSFLQAAGVDVAEDKLADDMDAEIWLLDKNVIKASLNPWKALDTDVKMLHVFMFDEDDTSPVGQGLPSVMRDSQMAVCAAARMLMDNASIVCGPNVELNTSLLRPDQDLQSLEAYRKWYRDDDGPTAQWPAVRNVELDSHIEELLKIIELWMKFADQETFVGPATGGDMAQTPSEPMRTAAGASMMRGDAALPFKDIIRSFDRFTQSIIESLVQFNRKFNPDQAPEGDYNVIARGASSLMAKEVRGMQIDQLAQTLTPAEQQEVDMRKFARARFEVRDLNDLLVSQEESDRRASQASQQAGQQADQQQKMLEANLRELLAKAYKDIAQGAKNSALADASTVTAAVEIMERGLTPPTDGATNGPTPQGNSAQSPGTS